MKPAEHDTCRAAGTVPEDPCASIPRDPGDRPWVTKTTPVECVTSVQDPTHRPPQQRPIRPPAGQPRHFPAETSARRADIRDHTACRKARVAQPANAIPDRFTSNCSALPQMSWPTPKATPNATLAGRSRRTGSTTHPAGGLTLEPDRDSIETGCLAGDVTVRPDA